MLMQRLLFISTLLIFIACNKELQVTNEPADLKWTPEQIDQHILNAMGTDQTWDWTHADNDMVFAATQLSVQFYPLDIRLKVKMWN